MLFQRLDKALDLGRDVETLFPFDRDLFGDIGESFFFFFVNTRFKFYWGAQIKNKMYVCVCNWCGKCAQVGRYFYKVSFYLVHFVFRRVVWYKIRTISSF